MENLLLKTIRVSGKNVSILLANGTWWVAVKPICEVLNVDYVRQFKNLKEDDFFAELLSNQTIVAADKKQREMLCLPEQYVYGWLLSIKSDSPEMKIYRKECYDVLYSHFHGQLTFRADILMKQRETLMQIEDMKKEIQNNPKLMKLKELEQKNKQYKETLVDLDNDLVTGQTTIIFN